MIFGDFPPNSKVTLLRLPFGESFIIPYPTLVLPVKAILSTKGLLTK